jgi:hypothetical protein
MTSLLDRAFQEAAKLSEVEQNAFAKWLLDELAAERRWDKLFAESEDVLSKLADEALQEHAEGKTRRLEPDDL